jgi:hypothetical protein
MVTVDEPSVVARLEIRSGAEQAVPILGDYGNVQIVAFDQFNTVIRGVPVTMTVDPVYAHYGDTSYILVRPTDARGYAFATGIKATDVGGQWTFTASAADGNVLATTTMRNLLPRGFAAGFDEGFQ